MALSIWFVCALILSPSSLWPIGLERRSWITRRTCPSRTFADYDKDRVAAQTDAKKGGLPKGLATFMKDMTRKLEAMSATLLEHGNELKALDSSMAASSVSGATSSSILPYTVSDGGMGSYCHAGDYSHDVAKQDEDSMRLDVRLLRFQ